MKGKWAEESSLFKSEVIYGGRNEYQPKLLTE